MCTYTAICRTNEGLTYSVFYDCDSRRGSHANEEAARIAAGEAAIITAILTSRVFSLGKPGRYFARYYRQMETTEGETIRPSISPYGYMVDNRHRPHDLYVTEDGRAWIVAKSRNEDGSYQHGYAPAPDGTYMSRYHAGESVTVSAGYVPTENVPTSKRGHRAESTAEDKPANDPAEVLANLAESSDPYGCMDETDGRGDLVEQTRAALDTAEGRAAIAETLGIVVSLTSCNMWAKIVDACEYPDETRAALTSAGWRLAASGKHAGQYYKRLAA